MKNVLIHLKFKINKGAHITKDPKLLFMCDDNQHYKGKFKNDANKKLLEQTIV